MASDALADPGDQRTAAENKVGAVEIISQRVANLSTGDRAALRRMYLTERMSTEGIVVRLLNEAGLDHLRKPETIRPWRLLAHCAALLAGSGEKGRQPHAGRKPLGAALYASGLSGLRLLRLTSAKGSGLEAQVIRAIRMLSRRGEEAQANFYTLFDLVGNNDERADEARREIARDFYIAEHRSKKGTTNDD